MLPVAGCQSACALLEPCGLSASCAAIAPRAIQRRAGTGEAVPKKALIVRNPVKCVYLVPVDRQRPVPAGLRARRHAPIIAGLSRHLHPGFLSRPQPRKQLQMQQAEILESRLT